MAFVELWQGERRLWRRALGGEVVEVGSGEGCELVAEGLGGLRLRLRRHGERLCWEAVEGHGALAPGQALPLGGGQALRFGLEEDVSRCGEPAPPGTEVLCAEERPGLEAVDVSAARLWVLEPCGRRLRRRLSGTEVLRLGTAADNDLVVRDRTVSAHHCRIEAHGASRLLVRDLGSRNGTWSRGLRLSVAHLSAGECLWVGRTLLRLEPLETAAGEVEGGALGEASWEAPLALSEPMRSVLAEVEALGRLRWPVLLQGETGSGKERMARWIHRCSERNRGPFVAVNCGALPSTLLEGELFGHERGAFTGAEGRRRGLFEQAEGGTLLLDEIGEMPLEQQARLLRVLQSGRLRRLGSEREVEVDVRIVAATHRPLREEVEAGRFRADLYCRLARLVVRIPPLRERLQEVDVLAERFLREAGGQLGRRELRRSARARLLAYHWPGNVRELQNVVLTAAVLARGGDVEGEHVRRAIERVGLHPQAPPRPAGLRAAVACLGGNVSAAARVLGIPRSTLRDQLRAPSPCTGNR